MSSRRRRAIAALHELYAQLPTVHCKGLCADSCTVVPASELEQQIVAQQGFELNARSTKDDLHPRCPALGSLNQCRVYEDRPYVCRAFGVVGTPESDVALRDQALVCDYGCEPDGGKYVNLATSYRIMYEIERLSRSVTGIRRLGLPGDS